MTEERSARAVLGATGEALAERFLTGLGMRVLDRNWRCREGEIDLVLRDGDEIVVCEVKTRRSTNFGQPIEAITRAKLGRLRRLAGCWLAEHEVNGRGVRLDIVGLLGRRDGSYRVTHLRGVGQ